MKIFKRIKSDYAFFGIGIDQHPFNWRNSMAIFLFGCAIISNGVHMCCEVETFQEYAESIFMFTTLITTSICFLYMVCVMKRLFGFMDEAGELIDASEYTFPYKLLLTSALLGIGLWLL